MYRSPQPWNAPVARFRGLLNVPDAYRVEAAWGSLDLGQRILLRGHCCLRWPAPKICRVVTRRATHCSMRQFDSLLNGATLSLAEALDRDERENRARLRAWTKNLLATSAEWSYKSVTS
jgi:hypothetical protein